VIARERVPDTLSEFLQNQNSFDFIVQSWLPVAGQRFGGGQAARFKTKAAEVTDSRSDRPSNE
jgi:hypothetical protein